MIDRGGSTYHGPKPKSGNPKRNPNRPRVSPYNNHRNNTNKNLAKLPWIQKPKKPKQDGSFNFNYTHTVKTPSKHAVKQGGHSNFYQTRQESEIFYKHQKKNELEYLLGRMEGQDLYKDPKDFVLGDELTYDFKTGVNKNFTEAVPLMLESGYVPKKFEDAYYLGKEREIGRYSYGKDDKYFKKLFDSNYDNEQLFNKDTQSIESTPVMRLDAKAPEITMDVDFLGKYWDDWVYEVKGHPYLKEGAPMVPVEFDDDGNITKKYYDYYTVNDDGTYEYHTYSDEELKQFNEGWIVYRAFNNTQADFLRDNTKRMEYTAGWDPEATDSVMDWGRDTLSDFSKHDYEAYSRGNREGMHSMVGPVATTRMFKNLGGYFKNYLFTPLRHGDVQIAMLNGLVNLGETCDYAGVGTRAFFAPQLGIEYDKGDTAFERVAKAYTTHANFDPDTGSVAKDIGIYMLDPAIVTTLGGMGFAKLSSRIASKAALKALDNNLIKFGEGLASKKFGAYTYYAQNELVKKYKAISRDLAFADDTTIMQHAEDIATILEKSGSKYLQNTSYFSVANDVANDLRALQNKKSFFFVKATAASSDLFNTIDNVFLAGGLYLPYSVLKTVKGTHSILRNNKRIADHLTDSALNIAENAERVYKNFSGPSVFDFHRIINGFKNYKPLDNTEAFKAASINKVRKQWLTQQSQLQAIASRFKTSSQGLTNRISMLNFGISKIFKVSNTGQSVKTLGQLKENVLKEAAKIKGASKDIDDIFDNILKTISDIEDMVALAKTEDADKWITAISKADTSVEVLELYKAYLKDNSEHPIAGIEDIASDRFVRIKALEDGVSEDAVPVPDDMLVVNATSANNLNSVPLSDSNIDNAPIHSEVTNIPHLLGDAHEANKKAVEKVRKEIEDLIEKDADGNVVRDNYGSVKFTVDSWYVRDLYNYLSGFPGDKISLASLDVLRSKIGRALDSLKGKYHGSFTGLPNSEELIAFEKGLDDAKDVFVYSGGLELQQKLEDVGASDYYKLVRTSDSPMNYLPSESIIVPTVVKEVKEFKVLGGKVKETSRIKTVAEEEQQHLIISSRKLRDTKLSHERDKIVEEEYRRAERIARVDPNGVAMRKLKLRHQLKRTIIKKEDGVAITAWEEYEKLVGEYNKYLKTRENTKDLVSSLDIAFFDIVDATALTKAQAEKAHVINMAMSTYLEKVMDNPIIMDAVHKFDITGPYGYLIDENNVRELFEFLQKNLEAGRDTPMLNQLHEAVRTIATWHAALEAYSNFNTTLSRLKLSPREAAAVRELVLGNNSEHFRELVSRNTKAFIDKFEERLNTILGSDNLLIDGYRESILRTSHLDESIWRPDHFKYVRACEDQLADISKSDVKLQILQDIELDPNAIKRFNELAKQKDVYFIKTITDGNSPDSAIVRIELQKWVPDLIDENTSLPDVLKFLQDADNEYSHVFEISEKLTEKDALEQVVDLLDKGVKSGPKVKRVVTPHIVTHGRDWFDIDVLRRGCYRNEVVSASLSDTNMLFRNRTNTFKELMKQHRDHNCIDPDKIPDIAEAVSKLNMDLPEDPYFGIFNVSKFGRDLETLFGILSNNDFFKEVGAVYSGNNAFMKAIMDSEKTKALAVDKFDDAALIQNIIDIQDNIFKDDELLETLEQPIVEVIREERWRIEASPNYSDEEKKALIEELPEKIKESIEEDPAKFIPKFYNTLDDLFSGFKFTKKAVTDLSQTFRDAYYHLLSGSDLAFSVKGTDFKKLTDFQEATLGRINKALPDLSKRFEKLKTTYIPGTNLSLYSLLSDDLKKELSLFIDAKLVDFGWGLSGNIFWGKKGMDTLVNNINACADISQSLNEILVKLNSEFNSIKQKGLSLGDFSDEIPFKNEYLPRSSDDYIAMIQSKVKDPETREKLVKQITKRKERLNSIEIKKEDEGIDILPKLHTLLDDLSGYLNTIDLSSLKVFDKTTDNTTFLSQFNYIDELVTKYAHDIDIPEAPRNSLLVFSGALGTLSKMNYKEIQKFAIYLEHYRTLISEMIIELNKVNKMGLNTATYVDNVFVTYNQKFALLQQDLLKLHKNVVNQGFRESLSVTDSSPFIRDIFKPVMVQMQSPTAGNIVKSVKEEVKNLDNIRSSQVASCLNSKEFEGFEDLYDGYGFPMGDSAELQLNVSGEAFRMRKAYDIDNIGTVANLEQVRTGTQLGIAPRYRQYPDPLYHINAATVMQNTSKLLQDAKQIVDNLDEINKSINFHQVELDKLDRADELTSKREELLDNTDYSSQEDYEFYLDNLAKDAAKKKREFGKYSKQYKAAKERYMKIKEEGSRKVPEKIEKQLAEIDAELEKLPKIDDNYWGTLNYHENMLANGKHNKERLEADKQKVMDELITYYEWLKNNDVCDDIVVKKSNLQQLFSDIQYVIENTDIYIRVPVQLDNIPAHELQALNGFANRFKYMRDYKFKTNSFLDEVSTLEDWNKIINQTKKFAIGLPSYSPYHWLVYLEEPDNIEDAFLMADLLYNTFYKKLDDIKHAGLSTLEKNRSLLSSWNEKSVSNIMEAGFNSVTLDVPEHILDILQGDGLDLIYKGFPKKSYLDTIYHTSKITSKLHASANIADIIRSKSIREGWARKFAVSSYGGNTVREKVFDELENSQLEALGIVEEASGTPYESIVREYNDNCQEGLLNAQHLRIMDFISRDEDHLITHLLYHNGQTVVALNYTNEVYGKFLTKLKSILNENPMYISFKEDKYNGQLWIGLNSDAKPRILGDTKYLKEDTQIMLGDKVYDSAEMTEFFSRWEDEEGFDLRFSHIGIPDEIELPKVLFNGADRSKAIEYCTKIRDYFRTSYEKIAFLTEGAVKGSAMVPYTLARHQAIRKAAPVDWLANTMRGNISCDQRMFHTSQFDFNVIGEKEYRLKLGGLYDDSDILQNIKHTYDDLVGTVSTERMFIANFFDDNSHCKFNNILGNDLTVAEKLDILQRNPEQCVLILKEDKNTLTGFRIEKLKIRDELSIRQAEASNAIIADYETYVEMTKVINNSQFDKAIAKVWAKVVFFLKVGHLCNPGTWFRNWLDATIKATGETGSIGVTAVNQVKATTHLIQYNKIIKYVRDTYGVHHNTSKRIANEWESIQKATGTSITKEQFDFIEDWLKVSLSGGESHMLREMLKKQKYDPWRSGNLKPGDSFSYPGVEVMQKEFDYIGSDIYRFEQIDETEIKNLIEEGYLKGEEIFVEDFSADDFWRIFNQRKNPTTSVIEDSDLWYKYKDTVENILKIRNKNLFRKNRGVGSKIDYMCSCFLKPMSMVEQVVRLGQFMALEKQGYTRSEIFKSIANTQFEYELKSSKVRGAELVMTYFNFEYNNLRYWCNLLEQQPEYLYLLESLWNDLSWEAAQDVYEDEQFYNNPSLAYMMANGALPIGSSGLYLKMFPSALGALNWFYGAPSQFFSSVVPPAEVLLKEFAFRMGGDYAEWMSNMDYSYADEKTWEKALSMVPIAGTIYTRYVQHYKERQPWTRLDEGTIGESLVRDNPTVWGAIYQYNKPRKDDFDTFQKNLAKQGKWYDCNTDKVVSIDKKNTRGLNDPKLHDDFDRFVAMKQLYQGVSWDANWGGFKKKGHFTTAGSQYFDSKGNPKNLGLNRYTNLKVPGEWERLQRDRYLYHHELWDRNTDRFVLASEWKEEKLNRSDLTWQEVQFYMAEKGKYWDPVDRVWKHAPEVMHAYNQGYYNRGYREFRRWVNYGNRPPADSVHRKYSSGTTFNVAGKSFSYSYSSSHDYAALRMAVSGYKAYDDYYKFDYKYNYSYRNPNPISRVRGYNPIIRYHIIPS